MGGTRNLAKGYFLAGYIYTLGVPGYIPGCMLWESPGTYSDIYSGNTGVNTRVPGIYSGITRVRTRVLTETTTRYLIGLRSSDRIHSSRLCSLLNIPVGFLVDV